MPRLHHDANLIREIYHSGNYITPDGRDQELWETWKKEERDADSQSK